MKSPIALTRRQSAILVYIVNSNERTGIQPGIRDLCEFLQVGSTNTVITHFKALEKKGILHRAGGQGRAVRITDLGFEYAEGYSLFGDGSLPLHWNPETEEWCE